MVYVLNAANLYLEGLKYAMSVGKEAVNHLENATINEGESQDVFIAG